MAEELGSPIVLVPTVLLKKPIDGHDQRQAVAVASYQSKVNQGSLDE